MNWKIPFSDIDVGKEEIRAVSKVLKGRWLTMGSVTTEFENSFAAKMKVKHAIAVGNCTLALHLANVALGIQPGDEVICPSLTFVASANASRYCGAGIRFADVISERDLTVDPEEIRRKITPNTKAVTVVHYAGYSCKMDEIMEIASQHGLKVIEDCAHAPFGRHRFKDGSEKFVGSIGDIGCFSFFGNKNMTTGEGGMVTTNDDALASKIRLLRSHGMTTLSYQKSSGHAGSYDVVDLGYNYRTDEIHSAIGLCQLKKIDRLNGQRRDAVRTYRELLANKTNLIVPFEDRDLELSTCHLMPVIVKEGLDDVKSRLLEKGIQTSKHYTLIPKFTIYKDQEDPASRFGSLDNIMTLPLFHKLKRKEISLIASCF